MSTDCPSENDLLDLVSGRAGQAERLRSHLLGCASCQDLVGELSRASGEAPALLRKGDLVGRYVVLGVLGAGAMGVVYEAYDPELARKVALKLVRAAEASPERAEALRARLVREGQAVARLAHPNVIAVHDVGRFGEQVFVTLEQVAGGTLSAWLAAAPRSPREILGVFLQAGRGLAAAHAAGLVHRDFKPDNVLVGQDGRARVTDFGLAQLDEPAPGVALPAPARLELTRTGVALGTPAYMAPEQLAGRGADARSDVFAFCVALFEALAGARPFRGATPEELRQAIEAGAVEAEAARRLPRAQRAAIRRGLQSRPEARWPSMEALLAALDPEPRRRRLALGAVVASGALATLVAFAASRPRVRCEGAEAWGAAWDASARAQVQAAFARTGLPFAEAAFQGAAQALDARRDAWVRMSTQACQATWVQHTQSEALLDRRAACLDERRREVAALVTLLQGADAELVERAPGAVKALTALDDCANARLLGEAPSLAPAQAEQARLGAAGVAQARALRAAGRYAPGLEEAGRAVEAARASGAPRLLAEALVIQGFCQEELMRYPEAERTYHEAARVALAAHHDGALADAWMQLSGIAGYRRAQLDEALRWLGYAESAIATLGEDRQRRAKLYERRSLLEWSLEAKLEEADQDYARSLAMEAGLPEAEWRRFQGKHGPVDFDMGRYDQALAVFEEEVARLEREKGRDHPEMLEAAENKAEVLAILGRPAEAVAILRDLLARFPERAAGYTNHRLAEALRRGGDAAAALVEDQRALEAQKGLAPDLPDWAQPLTGQGLDLLLLGRAREAVEPLERAARVRAQSKLATARAETDFALARALWESGGDRARAAGLAQQAERAYREGAQRYGSRWFAAEAEAIAAWSRGHVP